MGMMTMMIGHFKIKNIQGRCCQVKLKTMDIHEFIPKWLEALRQPHNETKGMLIAFCNGEAYYCAVGVAAKVLGISNGEMTCKKSIIKSFTKSHDIPVELIGPYKKEPLIRAVTAMNDKVGASHENIANFIEENYRHLISLPIG